MGWIGGHLGSGSGAILSARRHLSVSADMFGVWQLGGGGVPSIYWVETSLVLVSSSLVKEN